MEYLIDYPLEIKIWNTAKNDPQRYFYYGMRRKNDTQNKSGAY